jgi:hypothetical protein
LSKLALLPGFARSSALHSRRAARRSAASRESAVASGQHSSVGWLRFWVHMRTLSYGNQNRARPGGTSIRHRRGRLQRQYQGPGSGGCRRRAAAHCQISAANSRTEQCGAATARRPSAGHYTYKKGSGDRLERPRGRSWKNPRRLHP